MSDQTDGHDELNDEASSQSGGEGLEQAGDDSEAVYTPESSGGARKSAAMVLLGILMIGGGAIYLMSLKAGPKAAAAASIESQAANTTIKEFLTDGGSNLRRMHEMLQNTEKVVQQFVRYPSKNQVPLEDLKTNPFRFSKPEDTAAVTEEANKKRAAAEKEQVAKAVANLNLQSIMHGGTRKSCMIGKTFYSEGQTVDGFTIEKINPGSVIVKNGQYRFELKMAK